MRNLMIRKLVFFLLLYPSFLWAQINTDRVMTIGRNALYFEDYVLSIQYFNQVINAKPYLAEPYFFRGLAKLNLDDNRGAEEDCSEAIKRNPFVVSAYQVRGLARIKQENYQGAIDDYQIALKYDPENIGIWHNMALCEIEMENYDKAKDDLNRLLRIAPKYTDAILIRGEVSLKQKDTIQARRDFDLAIEMDRYDGNAWASRAVLNLQEKRYAEAEDDLDKAIHLLPKTAGNYINRALARYNQKNLRGAMGDYDTALDIEPNNFLGHYNRGLLRAQVGDDNRAIEDFNFVIEMEPDNMMAIFNRALLLDRTGDYRGAVEDYTRVIDEYPNFWTGYQCRAEARRKMGDVKGAEMDEYVLLKAEIDRQNGVQPSNNANDDETTRKKSDKNMDNYRKLVVADDAESSSMYKSEYRGRVQNRNVVITLEPMYVLTYYEKSIEVRRQVHYYKYVDDMNQRHALPLPLLITNQERPLAEKEIAAHFASIDERTSAIVARPDDAMAYFARSLDFYLVQDFDNAIADLTQAILCDGGFFPAYFNRALVRYKQLEYLRAEAEMDQVSHSAAPDAPPAKGLDYDLVKKDLDKVIELAPDFVYAYYNRGNVLSALKDYRAAIVDYDKAIELDAGFAEAYFNRGLTHIFLGNNRQGIADLSKAGELGIASAYNIIKRFTSQEE